MATPVPAEKEDRIVFTSGSITFSVRDIIDAAFCRGEVEAHWQQLREGVNAQEKAQESELESDDEALDAAAIAFRYQYDLITAEETERWLELRSLSLADFSDYFARDYWRKNSSSENGAAGVSYVETSPELRKLFVVDLVLSGELDRMATRLAWRVASRGAAKDSDVESLGVEAERAALLARVGISLGDLPEWLNAIGRDERWLNESLLSEAAYRGRCDRILTDEIRQREISMLRLPLTRFDVEMLELESIDAAREAFLCVRDDGMSMAEVANEGRYPFHRTDMVLEEIAPDLQQKFLSLTPGSLLEPTSREDGFLLTRILAKNEPSLADASVRERVDARILERHFAELAASHITWSIITTAEPE